MADEAIEKRKATYLKVYSEPDIALAYTAGQSHIYGNMTMEQALIKLSYAKALNIEPVVALSKIYVWEAKGRIMIQVASEIIAAKIKQHPNYDFKVVKSSITECHLEFFEINGDKKESLGIIEYTMSEAKLNPIESKDNWRTNPRLMLYYRAIEIGSKLFCPDVIMDISNLNEPQKEIEEITEPIPMLSKLKSSVVAKNGVPKTIEETPFEVIEPEIEIQESPVEFYTEPNIEINKITGEITDPTKLTPEELKEYEEEGLFETLGKVIAPEGVYPND